MNPAFLWAKSKRHDEPDQPSMRLSGHLADVVEVRLDVGELAIEIRIGHVHAGVLA